MSYSTDVEEHFAFIVDSLSSTTTEFYGTLLLLREFGKRADGGDESARRVLLVVRQFRNLLRIGKSELERANAENKR